MTFKLEELLAATLAHATIGPRRAGGRLDWRGERAAAWVAPPVAAPWHMLHQAAAAAE
jgi:hypothetical protein